MHDAGLKIQDASCILDLGWFDFGLRIFDLDTGFGFQVSGDEMK